jgi:hypothetical protein
MWIIHIILSQTDDLILISSIINLTTSFCFDGWVFSYRLMILLFKTSYFKFF